MYLRENTKSVAVGGLTIGGGAPISVQSMTNVFTHEKEACLRQIKALAGAGADLVRLAVPGPEDTAALKYLVERSPVPLIADVHFHFDRALEAVAAGVAKIRLNPGNISGADKVKEVIRSCAGEGVAIRVGVNSGSIRARGGEMKKKDLQRPLSQLMIEKISGYLDIFSSCDFEQVVLSAKCSEVRETLEVYEGLAERFDFPLHLGFTAAGVPDTGLIKNSLALGMLLDKGIGDTVRVSLTADPVEEVLAGKEILCNLGLRQRKEPEVIACPTCGRCRVELTKVVREARIRLAQVHGHVRVAIMGCEVNGPGEAAEADYALCIGPKKALLYRHGKLVGTVPFENMVDELIRLVGEAEA